MAVEELDILYPQDDLKVVAEDVFADISLQAPEGSILAKYLRRARYTFIDMDVCHADLMQVRNLFTSVNSDKEYLKYLSNHVRNKQAFEAKDALLEVCFLQLYGEGEHQRSVDCSFPWTQDEWVDVSLELNCCREILGLHRGPLLLAGLLATQCPAYRENSVDISDSSLERLDHLDDMFWTALGLDYAQEGHTWTKYHSKILSRIESENDSEHDKLYWLWNTRKLIRSMHGINVAKWLPSKVLINTPLPQELRYLVRDHLHAAYIEAFETASIFKPAICFSGLAQACDCKDCLAKEAEFPHRGCPNCNSRLSFTEQILPGTSME